MKNIPTMEEYRAAVKKHFQLYWPRLSEEKVDEYLSSDEAREKIEQDYPLYKKLLEAENAGQEPPVATTASTPEAVGSCLGMMY